jgi:hypothetical protein
VPTPVTSGQLILQSEGAEVYYRDIEIQPITAIPAEFLAERSSPAPPSGYAAPAAPALAEP